MLLPLQVPVTLKLVALLYLPLYEQLLSFLPEQVITFLRHDRSIHP